MEWVVLIGIVVLLWLASRETEAQRIKRRRKQAGAVLEPVAYGNPNSAASSRWASDKLLKLAGLFRGKGIRIGLSQSGKVLHYGGPGNLILISPPRSGKMTCVLAPAILERASRKQSRDIIDSKGELYAVTHAAAEKYSEVVAVDPFGALKKNGVRGAKVVGCNPLAVLDPKSVSYGPDVDAITDGVFSHEAGGGDNAAFFNDSAALLLSTAIRAVFTKEGRKEERNLPAVRDMICRDVFGFARRFAHCGDAAVEAELSRYTSKLSPQSKSVEDIVSTFRTQTAFIGMEGIRPSLMHDGIRALDLKRKQMTVYRILPLETLGTKAVKWFRLLLSTWLSEWLKAGPRGLPILCVVDEFFSIGRLETFQAAMSQAAGAAGVQLWPVLQSLSQLQTMYQHEGWRIFLSNSAVKIFFGGANLEYADAEYISALCGDRELIVPSGSVRENENRRFRNLCDVEVTYGSGRAWERLVRPHEVMRMHDREMIVFCEKVPGPVHAKRKPYFEGWEFRGKYRPNPYWNGGR
jgi:type IV secretion system protein VirD4